MPTPPARHPRRQPAAGHLGVRRSPGNPAVGDAVTLEDVAQMPGVVSCPNATACTTAVQQLRTIGIEADVRLVVESFLAPPFLVAATDRIALEQARLANRLAARPASMFCAARGRSSHSLKRSAGTRNARSGVRVATVGASRGECASGVSRDSGDGWRSPPAGDTETLWKTESHPPSPHSPTRLLFGTVE